MFWVIAFLISVTGCSMMIYKIYIKWQLSPVIVSFAEKSTPVWQIPFPAVTICPETKAKRNHISFTKMYEMYLLNSMNSSYKIDVTNEDQLKAFEAVSQICDPHLTKDFTIKNLLDENDIVPLLNEMSVPKNDTITYCKWRNELHMNCSGSGLFSDIVTEEGMCQTFNILDASELFREEK
jgi:acid-sensing ion channel, other